MRMRPGASSAQDAVKEGKLLSDLLGPYCLAALLCLSDRKTMTTLRSLANVCVALVLNLNLCVE